MTNRIFFIGLLLLLQLVSLIVMISRFEDVFVYFYTFCALISFLVVLHIVNGKANPGYKIGWIIPIMIFPIFGGLFYVLFGGNKISTRSRRKMKSISFKLKANLKQDEEILEELKKENIDAYTQAYYMKQNATSPIYKNTKTEYLPIGEVYFERLIEELKKAKHYIFMEYFIIEEGVMWNTVLEILKKKVKEGVDVRLIYDDMGCIMTLPNHYDQVLRSYGIKCCVFNPFLPILTARMNNRDHRKVAVIDGWTAFTGGINLADEYINQKNKYGHWKDNGILLKGDAVWNLTIMFLSLWDYVGGEKESYDKYRPDVYQPKVEEDGYVQPYEDSPLDDEPVGETVYLNLINKASKYIYITTPYLIIDNETVTALCIAAKNGIEVKIVTPGIPDKKLVNEVTKAYYDQLIESGVEIYEYTPGFIHAKTFLVDDIYATVGTVNLDYRSLYLHFECGVWLYKTKCIREIKKDILDVLEKSKHISLQETRIRGWFNHIKRAIFRIIAPLL